MTPAEAAAILGVEAGAPWSTVRAAYLERIRRHHPDVAGTADNARLIIEAYQSLRAMGHEPAVPSVVGPSAMTRPDGDTLAFAVPAREAWGWIIDAVHDVGSITYIDESVPIVEVLCRFVGQPATSLVVTLQGRMGGTEAFCTAESIENLAGPPTAAVVDLLEDALSERQPWL